MGAPIWLTYECVKCKVPNLIHYATLPRINEEYLKKNDDNSITATCTDCNKKHRFYDDVESGKWVPVKKG